tara:strand:+ start:1218 stop:1367 length:150 start_codon:yes stop_codon:yes gene_type:complete
VHETLAIIVFAVSLLVVLYILGDTLWKIEKFVRETERMAARGREAYKRE